MLNRLPLTSAPPTAALESGETEQRFDLREILHFAWRHWTFIAALVSLSLIVGLVQLIRETPRYTAEALVLLDPRKEKAAGLDTILSDPVFDMAMIESQMAIIRSTVFIQRVVEKERLVSDPEFGSGTPSEPESTAPAGIPPNVMRSTNALRGATGVRRAGQGHVLSIAVTSVDPTRAARLANAVADAFVVDKLEARFEAAKRASAWLSDRVAELRKQLRESEEAVAQFRAEKGIAQSTNITLTQQQLSDLNLRLIAARADTAEKKARFELFQSSEGKSGGQNVPDAVNSALANSLRAQAATIGQKVADLAGRYSDSHPLVVNARAELRDVQRAIAAETQRAIGNMKNEYELAKAREEAFDRSLNEVTGQSGVDNKTAITLRELERTAAVNKSMFEDFLQRSKITQEQSTFEARDVRVITPAQVPGAPSSPQKGRTMMIALVIGLALGVGGAFAKEKLNSGFTTPRQIEEDLEVPLLASVSRMRPRDLTVDGKPISIPLWPAVRPLSRYSESMRSLRSGIQMTDVDDPPRVIQLTSAIPSEGKTTIALSFAVSAASSGLKVLFIDADLRHPSSSRFFGLHKEIGLVDLLLGEASAQQVIRFHSDTKLWTLSSGSKTQNPPDLLSSERMRSLVATFKETFDLVVIDTPPVGPVIDPIVISQFADKVVFVVRWAATARELVEHSIQKLSGHKKVAGVVFNHVHDGEARKYGKYAYSYYYGSRYYKKYYTE